MKARFLLVPAISCMILISCSTVPICITPSNMPLHDKSVSENLGKTEGKDSAYSILGLFMIGRPDIEAAMKEAIKAKNGDALINIRCYETSVYFILFSVNTVRVEGEAVKFAAVADAHKEKERKK
jgi:hypothetical protein